MELSLPVEIPKTFDCYHDLLTHHYAAPVFYDALKRELSFAKREGNLVGVVKFFLKEQTTLDQLLYFANELELAIRQHDLISRLAKYEFAVLMRFDADIPAAFQSLIERIRKVEKREFQYSWTFSDGTKGLEQVLDELDNPQIIQSSKKL
jgi:GGDEF domain-containing protein